VRAPRSTWFAATGEARVNGLPWQSAFAAEAGATGSRGGRKASPVRRRKRFDVLALLVVTDGA